MLELLADTIGLLELDEFRRGLLHGLRRVVPADWISLNDVGPDPDTTATIIHPPYPAELLEAFVRLAHQNPLVQRINATRDGRAYRFSDVITSKELRAREIYKEVYGPMGVNYQIAFTLPHAKDRILGVALVRCASDFTDAERDLLNQARPFLIQAYRNAIRYSQLLARHQQPIVDQAPDIDQLLTLGLTTRQAQVIQLLATGATERDIATHLHISHRTVQKHLQRSYRTLNVNNRSQAARLAWATLSTETPKTHMYPSQTHATAS